MVKFIARMIKQSAEVSTDEGKDLYRKYFINTSLYTKYKEDVDNILKSEGLEDIIVTE